MSLVILTKSEEKTNILTACILINKKALIHANK